MGLPFPSPGDLPRSGMEPASPALIGGFFTSEPPVKSALATHVQTLSHILPTLSFMVMIPQSRGETKGQNSLFMNTQLRSVRARNLNPGLSDFKGHAITHYFASASGCPHGFSPSLGQPPWSLMVHSRSESMSSGPDRHTFPTSTSWVMPRGHQRLGQPTKPVLENSPRGGPSPRAG